MSKADEDPHPGDVDTSEFLLDGAGLSALLIHGLSGTPYEMRYLGERLAAAGVRVQGVRLAGHAGAPEELGATTHANWYESVVERFERLREYGDPNVVIGLSMGAVLAARLAADQREAVSGLMLLAPAFFLPLKTRMLLRAMKPLGGLADRIYFHQPGGSDIHDNAARAVHPGTRLMPLSAVFELRELCELVRPRLHEIVQPTMVIHGRQDHTCPYEKNVEFVMSHLGASYKRVVTLDESFHVITVDTEKERVADEALGFITQFSRGERARASG
ncbi:MAG: alpha/beta hydrolase [Candidatus Binataceae bacterium]